MKPSVLAAIATKESANGRRIRQSRGLARRGLLNALSALGAVASIASLFVALSGSSSIENASHPLTFAEPLDDPGVKRVPLRERSAKEVLQTVSEGNGTRDAVNELYGDKELTTPGWSAVVTATPSKAYGDGWLVHLTEAYTGVTIKATGTDEALGVLRKGDAVRIVRAYVLAAGKSVTLDGVSVEHVQTLGTARYYWRTFLYPGFTQPFPAAMLVLALASLTTLAAQFWRERASNRSISESEGELICKRADSLYSLEAQERKAELIKTLAAIDQDHVTRGLYNSSARISARRDANRAGLRETLGVRVTSLLQTYPEREKRLDRVVAAYLTREARRIADEWKEALLEEADRELDRSQLRAPGIRKQLRDAVRDDVEQEHDRAVARIELELAQERPGMGILRKYGPKEPKEWVWRVVQAVVISLIVGAIGWKSGFFERMRAWLSPSPENSAAPNVDAPQAE